MLIYYCTVTTL